MNKELQKQYRLEQWTAAIRDQKASGLSVRQWCEENHVSKYQYYYRQRAVRTAMEGKLERYMSNNASALVTAGPGPANNSDSPEINFIQVPQGRISEPAGAVMRIRRRDVVVEISNDASDRFLTMLREVILNAQ